jgi:hypothetical protein
MMLASREWSWLPRKSAETASSSLTGELRTEKWPLSEDCAPHVGSILMRTPGSEHELLSSTRLLLGIEPGSRLTGNYSGSEVRFEDIVSDLLEPRFWGVSELTIREC